MERPQGGFSRFVTATHIDFLGPISAVGSSRTVSLVPDCKLYVGLARILIAASCHPSHPIHKLNVEDA